MKIFIIILLFFGCSQYDECIKGDNSNVTVEEKTDYYFDNDLDIKTAYSYFIYIMYNISYKNDKCDYWQLPEETHNLKSGDCEDSVLLYCYLLETKLNIRTNIIMIKKSGEVHVLANYDKYYIDTVNGYFSDYIFDGWEIIYTIPYYKAIWMTYNYNDNVGEYI